MSEQATAYFGEMENPQMSAAMRKAAQLRGVEGLLSS